MGKLQKMTPSSQTKPHTLISARPKAFAHPPQAAACVDAHFWVRQPEQLANMVQTLLHPANPLSCYIALDMYHPRLFRVCLRAKDWPVLQWLSNGQVRTWFKQHGIEPLYPRRDFIRPDQLDVTA
jgi:hypothetical protein